MKKLLFALLASILVLSACSGIKDASADPSLPPSPSPVASPPPTPTPSPTPTPTPTPEPEPEPDLTGLALNPLTGEYIDEQIAARRPVAVVINNLNKALPQSGISQADVIYEVLAEGGITRMIAVFKDFNAEKIGPVRSTRHYFLDFALDNDAVFAHHGGSPQGYSSIANLRINNLDGMALEGKIFYRDPVRRSQPGMLEHSSYTSAEGLLSEIEAKSFRAQMDENFEIPFDFYGDDEIIAGDPITKITVPYSPQSQTGVFEYDEENNVYLRSQNGNIHIDELTGEQLSVNNVLVQYVNMYVISGDDAGRREVTLVSQGEGVLFTQGISLPVKWSKESHQSPTVWTNVNDEKLVLTKGKTWICVLSDKTEIITESGAN